MNGTSPQPAKRVLVVDDDGLTREIIAEWLSTVGYGTEVASDVEEAIRQFDATRVDLVITDVHMRGRSGWELIEALSSRRPGLRVIAMSGLFARSGGPALPSHAVDDLLKKPFTREELLGSVRNVIGPPRE